MYFFASLFATSSAQSWIRRAYYDDTRCQGSLSVGVSLPARYPCTQTSPFISVCEVKGQDPAKTGLLKSSEASGCMPRSGEITDAPWVPIAATEGKLLEGASYMTVNAYTDSTCSPTSLYEQDMFLADNKCRAVEFETSFFRATCVGNVGTLTVCSDSLCQDCSAGDLFAGIYQVRSTSGDGKCTVPSGGMAFKVICSVPSASTGSGSGSGSGSTTGNSVPATGTDGKGGSNSGDQKQAASLVGMAGLAAALLI
jgi:hypothetical protein